ncbi:FAD-dependent oxidoreductase, partial [Burkholderia cenocepacia]
MTRMRTDVLVVGGGLGGVAAALAAARAGRSVVLTEEYAWLGGQLTSQAV